MTNQPKKDKSDYLKPHEVADRLGLSVRTVARLADRGRLPVVRVSGGHRRFDREEVEALVKGK